MFSALCVTLMFCTGIVPFATYAFPMLAGAFLIPIVVELGRGTAVMVYVSAALLSALVAVDKEAAMLFIAFFGYYPIIREPLEKLRPKLLGKLAKYAIFNGSVVGGFLFVAHVLGFAAILEGFGDLGRYSVAIFLLIGNVLFTLYDFALAQWTILYTCWFRPRFLRR